MEAGGLLMNKIMTYLISLMALMLMSSCQSDDVVNETEKDTTLTITTTDSTWTYINISQGKVVGTGSIQDRQSDAAWHDRTDWDIAICGDKIRTNSGTSGIGKGGMRMVNQTYENVSEVPEDGYVADSCNVEVW